LLIACGLGLLVWLALLAGSVLGWIGVALWLGQRLLGLVKLHSASAIGEVLAGVVVITLVARLPWCVGWIAWLIFVSWGLGAVVVTRFGTQDALAPQRPEPRLATSPSTAGSSTAPQPASTTGVLRDEPVALPVLPPSDSALSEETTAESAVDIPVEPAAEDDLEIEGESDKSDTPM
jgi:hypothetical protein